MTGKRIGEIIAVILLAVIATMILSTVLGLWIKYFWFGLILSQSC